ncbi:glycosyltransferase family 2 protein [Poritiphilus flavus]|uniref:Glycosyltransferase n=1 Tax=Poritiphilus flavus TaxID=2697053 RepID=A0A6L9EDV6_9FLAO|nr:glycosyltransferase family 2 protein [Poritiphilus flavus]NAS12863.1 glycosyltransferase [Poritiphilus flavus]
MKLSIVSPVYQADKVIGELVRRIHESVQQITPDYEIILVEDGGLDNSWEEIANIASREEKVKGIRLSRNFGQHYAITAGLDHARGEWIVVMDCDLQDLPEEIPKLFAKTAEGYEVVLASRTRRRDSFVKKFFSRAFYKVLSYLTGYTHDETIANFGIYHRKVIDAVISMRESVRYFPTMIKWVGFNTTKVKVEHGRRTEGRSSYNFRSLFRLAIDIILAFSDKPIRLLIKAGGIVSLGSIVVAMVYLYKWLKGDVIVLGYTSLIVSIWFLSGLIMATLGVVGLYVGKTFEGVRQRPLYIVKEMIHD